VQCGPFDYKAYYARRQVTGENREIADVDQSNVAALLGVKVWWGMIVEEHLDHDTEESAYFRHDLARHAMQEKALPAFYP
jgi:hypothetical protein